MKVYFLVPLLVVITTFSATATSVPVKTYVNKYKHIAIAEMRKTGVPASITLAQGIIESRCGKSNIARKKKNHFGIKRGDKYKTFSTVEESFVNHSKILSKKQCYVRLIRKKVTNYKAWTHAISTTKYAANPNYRNILNACIEDNDLSKLDR